MTKSYLRLLALAFLGSSLVPAVTTVCSQLNVTATPSFASLAKSALLALSAVIASVLFYFLLKALEPGIDASARYEAEFLDTLADRHVDLAIFGSAALSLFLELTMIRWQGTVFEFFAFYKNFGLLACFLGLGLGYALSSRDRIPLALAIPVIAWQFGLLVGVRYGMAPWRLETLRALPFSEQLNMGLRIATAAQAIAIYFFLVVVFLGVALAFIPIGQLCGRLMERREKLRSYGLNLLGSLFGVLLMFFLSYLWMPPLVWYSLAFIGILLFYYKSQGVLMRGAVFTMAAVVILAAPVDPLWQKIYSPYQLLELGHSARGLMLIRAAGHYYQGVFDLSHANVTADVDPKLKRIADYYELPYRIHGKPADVAIVGAGAGNDVAAALRSGAKRVDAVEIDPGILMAGKANHPEKPYDDIRVHAIVDDARSFLRNTKNSYDMIVYGLLDSHTLLSHASSVRLDSFVYTVEGLREARSRLSDGGVLSLSFAIINDDLGRKVYKMMQEAFDGHAPVCINAGYDRSVIFMQSKNGDLLIPPHTLEGTGFEERAYKYSNSEILADVSTDDWPFFYMPRRRYPMSYLVMIGLVAILSFSVTANFFSEKPRFSQLAFFFLGAGFMLVETKGITELGLTFGNTWQVIGVVISGILVMAYLANLSVQYFNVRKPLLPYLFLLASLAFGWFVSKSGGLPSTMMGRLETAIVLTCPIFFSGMVFSTLLSTGEEITSVMAINLLGAMCGGLVEYNSMYFGFRSLYLVAIGFYLLAMVVTYARREAQVLVPKLSRL